MTKTTSDIIVDILQKTHFCSKRCLRLNLWMYCMKRSVRSCVHWRRTCATKPTY
ncbi:hypothetical protein cypCar_00003262 [Cyprinus carpio]|nr:hypothetical protein cypCar_00003262 [Cyprinus carpio]